MFIFHIYTVSGKKEPIVFRHNFDKVQHIFIISGTIHLDIWSNWKNYKSAIITCTTLHNDDVSLTSSKCRFHEKKEKRQFISPLLWPPNYYSPDLNPVDYSVWSILQQKVYKTRITDLDDLIFSFFWCCAWLSLSYFYLGRQTLMGSLPFLVSCHQTCFAITDIALLCCLVLWRNKRSLSLSLSVSQTSHQNRVGQAGSRRHCCSCASVASSSFSLSGWAWVISSTTFNSDSVFLR